MSDKKPKIFSDLEKIVPIIPAPVFWLDEGGTILGGNDSAFEIIGATNGSELIVGKTPYDYYPKDVAENIMKKIKQVMEEKRKITFEESIVDIKTGKIKYFLTPRAPLFDDEGKNVVGTVGTFIEITERKRAEQLEIEKLAAEKAIEQLKLENELQGAEKIRTITSQVKHDITSPLASLKMLASKLKSGGEETGVLLCNATNRINEIVNNLYLKYNKPNEISSESFTQDNSTQMREVKEVSEPMPVTQHSNEPSKENAVPRKNPDYILIDDDKLLTHVWKIVADKKGIKLATFNSISDFEKEKHKFNKNTPIYVDHQLGKDNGLDYSEILAAEGFSHIYLATGFDKKDFKDKPTTWLKGIVSKDAPFIEDKN